jgi:hypothetical protein
MSSLSDGFHLVDRDVAALNRSFSLNQESCREYDVLVCGGGPAGCTAAIQAARLGVRVALVEKNGILGGTTVIAGVDFPGLFHAWGKQVIKGIGWEIITETVRLGGAVLPDFSRPPRRHWQHQVRVNRFIYSAVLDQMCQAAGVHLRLHEMPAAVSVADGFVRVLLAGKTGLSVVQTRKLVDATGDANIAALMGYSLQRSAHMQAGTLVYKIEGYDIAKVDKEELLSRYHAALQAGTILPTDHSAGAVPFWGELNSHGGNCMHVTGIDGATSPSRTEAEIKGRRALLRIVRFLRSVPGCEDLYVSYAACECGIRETRRIVGEVEIDGYSYSTGRLWPDAVCYSFYPIDIHSSTENTIDTRPLAPGIIPSIPYRALIPRGSDHLLAAGRCIAGDEAASSAYRVQASCMATGQVAGAAAALSAVKSCSVRHVELSELRSVLRAHDAIVPDALE